MNRRRVLIVGSITLFGALLRFSTLDVQSFWFDEAYTVLLIQKDVGGMLSQIYDKDMHPPLYYLIAHGWTGLFGTGEVGLRSLSALFGTATIPVAYAAANRLGGFRVGWMAAALVAANPLLVWFSQEGRSYSLLAFLGALSLLCFLRAREDLEGRWLAGWAVSSGLALTTHYAAIFLVAPELVWLVGLAVTRRRRRSETSLAAGAVVMVGIALLPLALHQHATGATDWLGGSEPLARRALVTFPVGLLTGLHPPYQRLLTLFSAALALLALALLLRYGSERPRREAGLLVTLGGLLFLVPLALALAGEDYLLTRNLITAVVPLAIVVALGAGVPRAGPVGIIVCSALCAVGVMIAALVNSDVRYQRDDWRSASEALAAVPAHGARAVVVTGGLAGPAALWVYLPGIEHLDPSPQPVSEVDLLILATRTRGSPLQAPRPPTPPPPAPGFHFVSQVEGTTFTLVRYRASPPASVSVTTLSWHGLTGETGSTLLLRG